MHLLYSIKEDIIYHVANDYNQDQDFISLEYDAWMSLVSAKDDFDDKKKKPKNEKQRQVSDKDAEKQKELEEKKKKDTEEAKEKMKGDILYPPQ